MSVYYNENDIWVAEWLRNLMADGKIGYGEVDDRSITEVTADDVRRFKRAHFFAGIAGWELALELAGWPVERPVWTGSCPCQSFSAAGLKKGFDDPRHLFPEWMRLIRECRPPIIFGEQVAGGLAYEWLNLVEKEMESAGYAFGAATLGAHSVNAPHKRQRVWFTAINMDDSARHTRELGAVGDATGIPPVEQELRAEESRQAGTGQSAVLDAIGGTGAVGMLENPVGEGRGGGEPGYPESNVGRPSNQPSGSSGVVPTAWERIVWVKCLDGKARCFEPGIYPVAPRLPGRVGKLRASGNSICPQTAAVFIKEVMRYVCS